jgi:hypothetical protein
MPNPYITTVNPYFAQQDQTGLMPVFQNIGQQQALQNQNLAQGTQLAQQAGQSAQSNMSGLNPLAMAAMLRKKEPGTGQMYDANGKIVADPTYGAGTAYGNMTSGEIANMMQNGV